VRVSGCGCVSCADGICVEYRERTKTRSASFLSWPRARLLSWLNAVAGDFVRSLRPKTANFMFTCQVENFCKRRFPRNLKGDIFGKMCQFAPVQFLTFLFVRALLGMDRADVFTGWEPKSQLLHIWGFFVFLHISRARVCCANSFPSLDWRLRRSAARRPQRSCYRTQT